ncbi:nitrogen assimilation regulatory protein [Monoraphidium neglectum]|uniref:Nitrogen assimilation regulatory protein n=1 Tax=Monoraphidium neglectum TaxID=145388 RepID=A0A0D2L4K8_9CHLO|nr:nitrogen assimilation regulatory protein [Monoraphidium neglectum]KIZ02049.1 nitrogen assimilation regulatory protein [Monoraphidium neglectum]|eukprot:XP_013901068.1 nitrogen assimilation regulatory protein [Monoraphidium neglectum]
MGAIVGSSKYADALRKQVVAAARDTVRRAVLVIGEPGMRPGRVAALIHYASKARKGLMAEVDCALIHGEEVLASRVFGRGAARGLLDWLGEDGTLLINNVELIDLLEAAPWLRALLRSEAWPEALNHGFTKYAFAFVLAGLTFGPQDRDHNGLLNMFWAWWWPGVYLAYPFVGRVWCSLCPFMIWGEAAQRWRVAHGAQLKKWPKQEMESYGVWAMVALFAGILVWEEAWDLPHSGALSAALLALITAGAVATSVVYEKRMWCRYLCPIGAMNGLMAKLSMTEVRGRNGVCRGSCSSYACLKGGPGQGDEGLASEGCPMQFHSAKLQDNSSCIMCMSCLKACPNGSVQLRLRPPGSDLWTTHVPSAHEACVMFMLLGSAYLHRLPALAHQLGLDPAVFAARPAHIAASLAVLAAPGLLAWAADAAGRAAAAAAGPAVAAGDSPADDAPAVAPPFLRMAYGYLPLVWGGVLATYEDNLMREAGTILPATAHLLGLSAAAPALPAAAASPGAVAFAQGATLLASLAASLALTGRLAGRAPWRAGAPQVLMTAIFFGELWAVVVAN